MGLMGLKKNLVIVLIINVVGIVIAFCYIQTSALHSIDSKSGQALTRSLQASGAQFRELEISGWLEVPKEFTNAGIGRDYFAKQAKLLFAPDSIQPFREYDSIEGLTIETESKIDNDIFVRLVLKDATLVISVRTANPQKSYDDLNRIFTDFVKGKDYHKSIVVSGILKGKKTPSQENEMLTRMLRVTHAQNVETMVNGRLVSITAYSPNVHLRLTGEKKPVNINMALRYNAVEKATFVYVGSPTITSEY